MPAIAKKYTLKEPWSSIKNYPANLSAPILPFSDSKVSNCNSNKK